MKRHIHAQLVNFPMPQKRVSVRFVPKVCTNPNPVNNLALVARLVNFLPIKVYRRSTTTKDPIVKFVVPT